MSSQSIEDPLKGGLCSAANILHIIVLFVPKNGHNVVGFQRTFLT